MMWIVENRSILEALDFTSFLTAFISDLCDEPQVKTGDWRGSLTYFLISFQNNLGFHGNPDLLADSIEKLQGDVSYGRRNREQAKNLRI